MLFLFKSRFVNTLKNARALCLWMHWTTCRFCTIFEKRADIARYGWKLKRIYIFEMFLMKDCPWKSAVETKAQFLGGYLKDLRSESWACVSNTFGSFWGFGYRRVGNSSTGIGKGPSWPQPLSIHTATPAKKRSGPQRIVEKFPFLK